MSMEKMYLEKLKDIINQNEISYCIIADLNNDTIDEIGDVTKLKCQDLVEQLFGNIQQIKLLNDSLAGQELPRSWKQGKVKCLICRPQDRMLVGLFYNESRSFVESIDFCNEIAIKIDDIRG